jgi:hypothetical protein
MRFLDGWDYINPILRCHENKGFASKSSNLSTATQRSISVPTLQAPRPSGLLQKFSSIHALETILPMPRAR